MSWMVDGVGRFLAHYLEKPAQGYEPFTPSDPDALRATLRPGDVLLVEGNNHISGVIKYLTQSTWSHAALYVGPIGDRDTADGEPLVLVEANIGQGVVAAPLSKYIRLPHPHLPADQAHRGRLRARLRLCRRAHRLRLRSQEHHRPDALSVSAAGAAALAPAHDGARLRPSDPHHLLGADRAGLRERALSDPAQGDAARRARRRGRKSWKSAIPRCTPRAISTSRPISRWSSRRWCSGFDYKAMAWADLPAADADELMSLVPLAEARRSRPTRCRRRSSPIDRGLALAAASALPVCRMIDAAIKALAQLFTAAAARACC